MDMGLVLKAGNVWNTLSKVNVSTLNATAVADLFKQFGHDLPAEQAQAIEALVAGAEPGMVATEFITSGALTDALMRTRLGYASGEEPPASMTRCPFCDQLHSA